MNRQREMELLAQVGHDLPGRRPGAAAGEVPIECDLGRRAESYAIELSDDFHQPGVRFSLAGVGMKFSMLRRDDRLTMPAHGEGGDWIVKTPDSRFRDVPLNEFAMMTLAGAVGIDVPEIMLVPRERVDERLPASVWPEREEFAYAIRRFDRDEQRGLVHIEDLAQVRNVYPEQKYNGNFETVASLIYRGRDKESLLEFTRRLTFSVLISNGDYHLKNWSLIYRDGRVPTLAPAYDLVSTAYYFTGERPEDLGPEVRRFQGLPPRQLCDLPQTAGAAGSARRRPGGVRRRHRRAHRSPSGRATRACSTAAPRLQEAVDQSISMRSKTIMRSMA